MIILNRREKLRASALPPEIPDTSAFVQKTDKASASKLGLVKIGDNVNISSGGAISVPVGSAETAGVYKVGEGLSVDENGAISASSAGGITETELFTGNSNFSDPVPLTDKIANYKYIVLAFKDAYDEIFTCVVPVSMVVLGTTAFVCGIPASTPVNIKIKFTSGETYDSIQRVSYSQNSTLVKVYGIK